MTFLIIIILIILLDFITVWGLQRTFPKFSSRYWRGIRKAFIIQATVSIVILLCGQIFQRQTNDYRLFALYYYVFGAIAVLYLPKAFYVLCLFIDWLRPVRFLKPDRSSRHIIAKSGLWTSVFFVFVVLWGILFGRYNFTVEHEDIIIDQLPQAFDGYKIVQISDVHAGSFVKPAKRFQKAVELINKQEPDLIVFTGDMVNNFAEELTSFIPIFSQLIARDGKYAVLGNHDYGGYFNWNNPADSVSNHQAIESGIEQMGFVLLNNQSVILPSSGLTVLPSPESIVLIGTENWGSSERRPKRGNLEKAMDSVRHIPVKILLTHDPSFWSEHVEGKTDIALTLSGHSHGMQLGIKLGKKHISPVFFFRNSYHHGVGLCRVGYQYLYINRGLGVIGFPGRIGMSPEITVITLQKEKSPAQPQR